MIKMSQELLESTLRELDQALYNHENWYKELIRSIACRIKHDQRDLVDDAYRQCRFGQWYYSVTSEELLKNPTFESIEAEHAKMHEFATRMLLASSDNGVVSTHDYDTFSNTLDCLRLNINALKHEIEETLYNRDPLTGVNNRVSMLSELRQIHELVKRYNQKVAIGIMDIDHFKAINDNHGHPIGDAVLKAVGGYILDQIRPFDKAFRYGGDEFLICMMNIDTRIAESIINRIRESLHLYSVVQKDSSNVFITASYGISKLEADENIESAIQKADEALYFAKESGRNQVCVWSETLSQSIDKVP